MRSPCARQRQGHDHPPFRVMTKAKPSPRLELLNELFNYQADTGAITWKISPSKRIKTGQNAGTVNTKGYLRIAMTIDGKFCVFAAHRLIWYIVTGADPNEFQIDHIDGNRLNNKFSNLRLATHAQNSCNRCASQQSKAKLKGVSWNKRDQSWGAKIKANGQNIWLGSFPTPELAHMAYCKAAAELHGEFARAV